MHIYVHYDKSIRLNAKKCFNAHIEISRGSPKQNIEYIKKEGATIIDKIGEFPHQGKLTISYVKNLSKDERDELPVNYYNIVNKN